MNRQKFVIVIIDDSKVIIDRLAPELEELAHVGKVMVGYTYEDGKELLDNNRIDIAIFDINLPGKSGLELLRLVKENKYLVKKIIMMTEDASEERREKCMILGADHFINKFTDFDNIPEIIQELDTYEGELEN